MRVVSTRGSAALAAVLVAVAIGHLDADAQLATGVDLPVVEHELANGLRLLVLPRYRAPTASLVVQYGLGGVNEAPGETGIAHLLEHLLFKGTETFGTHDVDAERPLFARMDAIQDSLRTLEGAGAPEDTMGQLRDEIDLLEDEAAAYVVSNEIDRILARNGARGLNATTDNESTTYYVELPANRVELWFLLESARMKNPVFREFYTERNVVAEERRLRVDTQPSGLLYEAHLAEAYTVHPYGRPVVGSMPDILRLDRRRVREYHEHYYGPNNAVIAIVGDVDVGLMIELTERYFGDLPVGDPPPPVTAREPVQDTERRIEVSFDAEPRIRIGWHVPEQLHDDAAALAMLSALLTGGGTSRLHQRLVVVDRLATVISSTIGPGVRFPRLFTVEATALFPHSTAEIEVAVYDELRSLRQTPPPDAALRRIRNQLEAGQVRTLTSHLGLAFQLAGSESIYGDWRTGFRLGERLSAVRPEDVSRVLERYFSSDNRTVAFLSRPDSGRTR